MWFYPTIMQDIEVLKYNYQGIYQIVFQLGKLLGTLNNKYLSIEYYITERSKQSILEYFKKLGASEKLINEIKLKIISYNKYGFDKVNIPNSIYYLAKEVIISKV